MAFMFRRIDTRRLLSVKQVINLYGHTNLGFTHSTRGSFVQSCKAVQPSLACLSNLVSSTHYSTLCSYGRTYIPVRPLEQSPSCAHNVSLRWGHVRCLSNESVTLKMDKDVIRFSLDELSSGTNRAQTRGSDRNGARMKDRKTYNRAKPSKRKKVNELKRYRLMAKKKMTSPNPEVRIRYKLEKAKRKEEWLIEKLRKFEVPKAPVEKYDPETLTEEEKFYLKRTGEKKKNYVPVGRRGVFGGVVLNMHLHWKKHETVKVICKPCKPGQIHQYAEELAQLSKGIVIDIKANNTIIFYRGKNYVQPKVMSPTETLSKKKALEKYTYEQSLEHTSQFIEKLEQELEEYHKHTARYKKGKEAMAEDAMADN